MKKRLSALWVRNAIGAVVAIVAVAVIVATVLSDQWTAYRRTVVPEVVVSKGQTGNAGGFTWRLDSVRHLNRNAASYGPELPAGAVLTVIRVDRGGTPKDEICNGVITDGERQWKAEGVAGFQPPRTEGVTSLCSQPGMLQFTFLMPQDAVPTAVDITAFDGSITVPDTLE